MATAYVTDFHARVFRPGNPDHKNLTAARIVVVLLGLVEITVACIMQSQRLSRPLLPSWRQGERVRWQSFWQQAG